MQFVMSNQAAQNAAVKILAYGGSGMGKTTLVATAPRPVIISAEGGLLSLKKTNLEKIYGVGNPHLTYDVPALVIETIADLNGAFRWLTETTEGQSYDTICMDSITEIAERVLTYALGKVKDPRMAYGELSSNMIALVKAYRDINRHVYMSSKMSQDKDEVSGMMMFGPMMPGKQVGPQLPYLFDEVFRLGVAKGQDGAPYRFLQTQPDMQYTAKDRSGSLDAVEYPDLTAVINKITSGV